MTSTRRNVRQLFASVVRSDKAAWLLPILAGSLLSLTLPFADIGFLAYVALVPLIVFALHCARTPYTAALGGLIAGAIYGTVVLAPLTTLDAWWWAPTSTLLWQWRTVLFTTFVLSVGALAGGTLTAAFTAALWRLQPNSVAGAGVAALIWMLLEYIRTKLVLGFTWGQLGYALHDHTYIAQLAHIAGQYGTYLVGAFAVFINVLIGIWLVWLIAQHREGALIRWPHAFMRAEVAAMVAAFLVALSYGAYHLNDTRHPADTSVEIAAIHSEYTTEQSGGDRAITFYMRALERAAAEADTVIMPENAFPSVLVDATSGTPVQSSTSSRAKRQFSTLTDISAHHPDTALLIGLHSRTSDALYNSLALLQAGNISALYHKQQPLPYFEYSPTPSISRRTRSFAPGDTERLLQAGRTSVTPLICSEILYPVEGDNDIIVNSSNETVFTSPLVARQNEIIATMRAIETERYVVRSLKGGRSSVIDPHGRIQNARSTSGILYATIPTTSR
jgi:apolipoprotein N-acyltransferase